MVGQIHPVAAQHLPTFITAPGQTDVLLVVTAIILGMSVVGFGVLFLRLHTLPERVAHKAHKIQFEIVAILGLLALFTHMHIFWVAGLLLAFIDLPDFGGFLSRIAGSVEKIAGKQPRDVRNDISAANTPRSADIASDMDEAEVASTAQRTIRAVPGRKELDHA